MYGQMTAGSWIYIGSQGILQGTYETFGAVARTHFGGTLAGRFVLTAGLGGMGGAQPLAATMNGAAILGVDVDESRIDKRLATRLLRSQDARVSTKRSRWIREATRAKRALSVGLVGNARRRSAGARAARRHARRAHRSDERARHAERLRPDGHVARRGGRAARARSRASTSRRANASIVAHVQAMLAMQRARRGHVRLRQQHPHRRARQRRARTRSTFPGFVPEYIRPLFCEGKGPFRWVALSGDPEGHRAHRRAGARALPATTSICAAGSRWRANASTSRDCRRASAGSARASARSSASRSTISSRAASCRRRSSSAAIISTPAASRRRSARRKR